MAESSFFLVKSNLSSSQFHQHAYREDDTGSLPITTKPSLWEMTCKEVLMDRIRSCQVLYEMGISPDLIFREESLYPEPELPLERNLDMAACTSQEFVSACVFPVLLPAIQNLCDNVRKNRVLSCKKCKFDPIEYVIEYLYNNNSKHPYRAKSPLNFEEIPFVKKRPVIKKEYQLDEEQIIEEATRIIQKHVRGFLARARPDVQELRQFWKAYKMDNCEDENSRISAEGFNAPLLPRLLPIKVASTASTKKCIGKTPERHSDQCLICQNYQEFLENRENEQNLPKSHEQEEIEGRGKRIESTGTDVDSSGLYTDDYAARRANQSSMTKSFDTEQNFTSVTPEQAS